MNRLLLLLLVAFTLAAPPPAMAAKGRAAAVEAAVGRDSALLDLYAPRRFAPFWLGGEEADGRRAVMLALLAREERLAPAGPGSEGLSRGFEKGAKAQIAAELALTRAALDYLGRRAGGRAVRPATAARALEALAGQKPKSGMELALTELRVVEAVGGWSGVRLHPAPSVIIPPLTPVRPELELVPGWAERPRAQPDVPQLRRRLVQSFDLGVEHLHGEALDPAVIEGLRRFQARHGLVPDGIVGARTIAVLNQDVGGQIRQVELNMARVQDPGRARLARYVEVNVPAFELRLVAGGRVAYRSRVIVGDRKTPTPLFDDWLRYIDLNPSWYVPRSIVPEIVEKEAKEPGYMSRAGFVWRGGEEGAPARLVQRPGPENALGRLKFVFPNHHAVYIHDTPNRGLFSSHDRTLSHGCIRLEQPMGLAVALLEGQGWDQIRIEAALDKASTRRVHLEEPVAVFLDYRTATLAEDGRLQLWPDIYGHDEKGVIRFRTKGLPPKELPAPPPVAPPAPQGAVAAGASAAAPGALENPAPTGL